ncbi:MAG: hypothetical protein HFJ75_03615 [Eggerthellaceae bacterium]|nr:hypothetical protein [Eggerthellaceae bacterium]
MKQKVIGLVLAALFIVLGMTLQIEGLSHEGTITLFTMLAGVSLWICGSLPFAITGLLLMLVLILTGAGTSKEVVAGFMSDSLIFLIFCFTFGTILNKTSFAPRIAAMVLRFSKGKSKRIVLGYLMGACTVSMFMHNMAAIAIFMPIGITILEALGCEKVKSNLGKCMMFGLAIAAMTGGCGTPMGNPVNALCLSLLAQTTGGTVPFISWCVAGMPLAWVITYGIYFSLTHIYKPEQLSAEQFDAILARYENPAPITRRDWLALGTLIVCIALLVAGSWISMLSLLNVALLGLVWMTFPGIGLITWDEIVQSVNWEAFMMFGTVSSVVAVMISTGATAWLATMLTGLVDGLPIIAVLMMLILIGELLQWFTPFAPALAPMLVPTYAGLAVLMGFSPAVATVICAFVLGAAYIMPISLPVIITMGSGYFQPKHAPLAGILPTAVMVVVGAIWLPFALSLFGV